MLFTDPKFLFLFLPVTLAVYFVSPRALRNAILLAASIAFYAAGESVYTIVMIVSILFNYGAGLAIGRMTHHRARLLMLAAGIVVNLGLLASFKYADFIVGNWNFAAACLAHIRVPILRVALIRLLPMPKIALPHVHLPVGISFFTFHALSYLADVYRREVRPMRSLTSFALYITLFPQLIAGPIIRYKTIQDQFSLRRETWEGFAEGVRRFVVGFGKKMLIANNVALAADAIFSHAPFQLSPATAWLGVVCYTLQIYFDFSGYSDMAIGMGRMFGFRFPENFNYPYIADSITDFWRRWHISLSTWFRDYLYIPLGGNRVSRGRTYFNLLVVFFLCGLWHGASWSFVAWGLFHGAFLIIERAGLKSALEGPLRPLRHVYVLLVVMVGWVLFRSDTLSYALHYLAMMIGVGRTSPVIYPAALFIDRQLIYTLIAGAIFSVPVIPRLGKAWEAVAEGMNAAGAVTVELLGRFTAIAATACVFVASASLSAAGTYSPFIYFRF